MNLFRKSARAKILWRLSSFAALSGLSLGLGACTDSVLNNKDFMPATGREGPSPISGPAIYPIGGVNPNAPAGPNGLQSQAPTGLDIEIDPILDSEDPKALTDVKVLKMLFPTATFNAFDLADAPPVISMIFSLSNVARNDAVLQTTAEITQATLSVKIGGVVFEETYKSDGKAILAKTGGKDSFNVKMMGDGGSKSRGASFYIQATRKHVGDDNASQQLQDLYKWRGEIFSIKNVYMGRVEGFIIGK